MPVEPRDHEIGELIAVLVLHQHVAVPFDPERRQVHHLGVAAGLFELIDERVARGERLRPVRRAARDVAEVIAEKYPVIGIAAVHRVGDLAIGDLAVVLAVSCPHRAEAFDACRDLIDILKASVPIWKHQRFGDGTAEWVGTP